MSLNHTFGSQQTWEADLRFADRYLIDEYPTMPDWKPRVWHFDLEWDVEHDFTTVMAVIDSYNNDKVLFCWKEGGTPGAVTTDNRHAEEGDFQYVRHCYASEKEMHDAFLDYLDECNPDVLIAHAIMWADLPHLVRRLKNFRRLSPLNRVRRPPKGKRGYDYTDQPILGRLCFDTAAPAGSGTGFERVWKDSGKPQLASLKLNDIAIELKYGGKFDMDVHTGWYERFDEYCDYCMQDTILVKRIDEENHVLDFFFSLQRICGVMFESCHNVTRFARGLLSRRTDWKVLTRPNVTKEEYEGALVPPPNLGRYEGVACLDYKGLYPSIILSHNLSWETQRHPSEYRGDEE
jgi:DNA polymerase I